MFNFICETQFPTSLNFQKVGDEAGVRQTEISFTSYGAEWAYFKAVLFSTKMNSKLNIDRINLLSLANLYVWECQFNLSSYLFTS